EPDRSAAAVAREGREELGVDVDRGAVRMLGLGWDLARLRPEVCLALALEAGPAGGGGGAVGGGGGFARGGPPPPPRAGAPGPVGLAGASWPGGRGARIAGRARATEGGRPG